MDATEMFASILGITRPWYVDRVVVNECRNRVDIYVDHEDGIRARCPVCEEFWPVYDHSPEREYRHLDVCQMAAYVRVRLPRVNCRVHGVRQIASEFGEGRSRMTYAFERRLLKVAQVCDIKAAGELCNVGWDSSWGTIERAVERGFARKPHRIPEHIGVDEKSIAKGHVYETLVYDNDKGTVEYVCDDRGQASLEAFYRQFEEADLASVKSISMDMWDPYIAATKACVPYAEAKIVFDRYHVMKYVVDAVDAVRKEEHRALMKDGDETLKRTKYLWLTNHENVPEHSVAQFEKLRRGKLKVARAWALKEHIRSMWDYQYGACMRKFFDHWYRWAAHCRLAPMKRAAMTLKRHIDNIVTYARHHVTNALGECINGQIEKVKRMACGFRNRFHYRIAIYFHCGGLDMNPYGPLKLSLQWASSLPQPVVGTH